MDHKEMCYTWVEDHKEEGDNSEWWIIDGYGKRVEGPFASEALVDDILWPRSFEHAHERYL